MTAGGVIQFTYLLQKNELPHVGGKGRKEDRGRAERGAPVDAPRKVQLWNCLIRRERFCSRSTSRVMPSSACLLLSAVWLASWWIS